MPRFSTEVMMRGTQPLVGGQTQCALGRGPSSVRAAPSGVNKQEFSQHSDGSLQGLEFLEMCVEGRITQNMRKIQPGPLCH